jgi:hypothetical protein
VKMLESATSQAPPTKGGKLWRLLVGEAEAPPPETSPSELLESPPDPMDQAPPPAPADLAGRVARMETGLRLFAETLKRMHAELSASLAEIRAEVSMTATSVDVRRAMAEALEPLGASIESLSETAHALPLTLGAATERLSARIDTVHGDLEETLIALMPATWDPPPADVEEAEAAGPDPDFWGRAG